MKHYVDGFVIPIPKGRLEDYCELSESAGKIWKEHGALDYKECVLEHDGIGDMRSFTETAGAKKDETVIFAFITYESRKHRDEVNAKVMADPRITGQDHSNMPFEIKRMSYAGFQAIVDLG